MSYMLVKENLNPLQQTAAKLPNFLKVVQSKPRVALLSWALLSVALLNVALPKVASPSVASPSVALLSVALCLTSRRAAACRVAPCDSRQGAKITNIDSTTRAPS